MENMNNINKKIKVLILIFIIIILIGLLVFFKIGFLTIEQSLTWIRHDDSEIGFSIKYPSEFNVRIDTNASNYYNYKAIFTSEKTDHFKKEGIVIEIEKTKPQDFSIDNVDNLAFESSINIIKTWFMIPKEEDIILEENIIIDGVFSKKLYVVDDYSVGIIILLDKGENYYMITAIVYQKDIYLPIFNKMLSTFRFLD